MNEKGDARLSSTTSIEGTYEVNQKGICSSSRGSSLSPLTRSSGLATLQTEHRAWCPHRSGGIVHRSDPPIYDPRWRWERSEGQTCCSWFRSI